MRSMGTCGNAVKELANERTQISEAMMALRVHKANYKRVVARVATDAERIWPKYVCGINERLVLTLDNGSHLSQHRRVSRHSRILDRRSTHRARDDKPPECLGLGPFLVNLITEGLLVCLTELWHAFEARRVRRDQSTLGLSRYSPGLLMRPGSQTRALRMYSNAQYLLGCLPARTRARTRRPRRGAPLGSGRPVD